MRFSLTPVTVVTHFWQRSVVSFHETTHSNSNKHHSIKRFSTNKHTTSQGDEAAPIVSGALRRLRSVQILMFLHIFLKPLEFQKCSVNEAGKGIQIAFFPIGARNFNTFVRLFYTIGAASCHEPDSIGLAGLSYVFPSGTRVRISPKMLRPRIKPPGRDYLRRGF